jgi:hypothetical protein
MTDIFNHPASCAAERTGSINQNLPYDHNRNERTTEDQSCEDADDCTLKEITVLDFIKTLVSKF